MRRCLVVANQNLGGDRLVARVRERMRQGPSHLHPERRWRWPATDLPSRIRRTDKLPVTQVTGAPQAPEG